MARFKIRLKDISHGDQIKQTNYFLKTLFIKEQRGFLLI